MLRALWRDLGKTCGRQHGESAHRKQKLAGHLKPLLTLGQRVHTRCSLECHYKHIWPSQCVLKGVGYDIILAEFNLFKGILWEKLCNN